jgi:ribonuclease Z
VAARPFEDIPIRKNLVVRPFAVNHMRQGRRDGGAQALGYTAIEVRKKLKAEYSELTGPQLVDLKRQGIEITRRVELPLVTYSGDTGPGEFFELDFVRNSRVFLLECTFVAEEHRERARAGNHMHLQDLQRVLPTLNNERIVLTHLTRRTSVRDAQALLRQAIGSEADERVSFLMGHRRPRPARR